MTVQPLDAADLCRKNASSLFDQRTRTHFIADGAFDWDGYALVGIAPGLYKKETGGRREGSCAVRWQSFQENFPATCWRRIQVWVNSRSEEHTSELQSRFDLVCRLLLEKKKKSAPYLFLLPYIIVASVFFCFPLVRATILAFYQTIAPARRSFVAFSNFRFVLTVPDFHT